MEEIIVSENLLYVVLKTHGAGIIIDEWKGLSEQEIAKRFFNVLKKHQEKYNETKEKAL